MLVQPRMHTGTIYLQTVHYFSSQRYPSLGVVWVSDYLPLECNGTSQKNSAFPLPLPPYIIVCHFLMSNMLDVRVGVGQKTGKCNMGKKQKQARSQEN